MKRLVLIDGNAILHRAYHALPPLTAPDGSLVNAVYGFTTMLLRIFNDLKPSYIIVCFDRPKPTFRKKMFEGYQSKRPKMDEELVGQIEKVHEVVRAFGIPIFEKDGFEADDVIGTLARRTVAQTIIVTGDKDILQLVDANTYVYMPTKGLSEAKLYKENDVIERLGVDAKHVADFKGLAGDSSDNYPGVGGIGPKTAVSLLKTFGTVEAIYTAIKKKDVRIKKFSASVIEKLTKGEESARLSKDLATIRTTVKLDGNLKYKELTTLDTPEVRQILGGLHFHSLLKRLDGGMKNYELGIRNAELKTPEKPAGEQQQLF